MRRIAFLLTAAGFLLTACGSKVPAESGTEQAKNHAELKKSGDGYSFYSKTLNREISVSTQDGVSEEYVRRCADDLENMSDALFADICEGAKQYCLWSIEMEKDALGEEYAETDAYHKVTEDTPAAEMRPLFDLYDMYIYVPDDENIAAYTLSRWCDWEVEHGIEVIIKGGALLYVGSSSAFSPWEPAYYTEGEGRAWNYAHKGE